MDKTQNAVAIFDKLANLYQSKFMNVDLYSESLDFFCAHIPKANADILELACGPGNISKYMLDKRPDFSWLGTDLAPQMLALAAANNPNARFELMDCRAIGQLELRYDGLVCGFCFPYLSKEEAIQLIGDAAQRLLPDGLIYISTMEDDYEKSGMQTGSSGDQMFMHYHQFDYLSATLEANGFQILYCQRKTYPYGGNEVTDLLLIAQKL